jgi:hypothetical protein
MEPRAPRLCLVQGLDKGTAADESRLGDGRYSVPMRSPDLTVFDPELDCDAIQGNKLPGSLSQAMVQILLSKRPDSIVIGCNEAEAVRPEVEKAAGVLLQNVVPPQSL